MRRRATSPSLNRQIIPEIDRHQPNQQMDAYEGRQNGVLLFFSAMGNMLDARRVLVKNGGNSWRHITFLLFRFQLGVNRIVSGNAGFYGLAAYQH